MKYCRLKDNLFIHKRYGPASSGGIRKTQFPATPYEDEEGGWCVYSNVEESSWGGTSIGMTEEEAIEHYNNLYNASMSVLWERKKEEKHNKRKSCVKWFSRNWDKLSMVLLTILLILVTMLK